MAKTKPDLTPAQVICRCLGCGLQEAKARERKLGEKAKDLPGLYEKQDGLTIRQILSQIDSEGEPARSPKQPKDKTPKDTTPPNSD